MLALHRPQRARGRRRVRVAQACDRRRQGVAVRSDVCGRAVRGVERARDWLAIGQHLRTPIEQRHFLGAAPQPQSRLAPPRRRQLLIAHIVGNFLWRIRRAVPQQAMQQEYVQDAHGLRVDAHRTEWIDIHQPHLDILDASLAQRVQRTLARANTTLGPDRSVEFVFDLQHAVDS